MPANAVGQRNSQWLTLCLREQARSYKGSASFLRECIWPQSVGAGLLANVVGQRNNQWLTLCIRGQARSYKGPASF